MALPGETERVTCYFSSTQVYKLKLLAEQEGVALAHVIRNAIKTYLEGKGV